jgi:hypothetical protein
MSDDEYEIPLQDQRAFGAGLKRKRIRFVPSSIPSSTTSSTQPAPGSTAVGDRYLNLVLSKPACTNPPTSDTASISPPNPDLPPNKISPTPLCETCSLPISCSASTTTTPPQLHEATLAHQVCLQHSHPPSHLDRSRLGLRYLQSQGWDPDSRLGLGAHGQGIQFPIKAKKKNDKTGLGLVFPDNEESNVLQKEVNEKLDAGKVRKLEEKDRKKRERLQELFYRSEDLGRYLGSS